MNSDLPGPKDEDSLNRTKTISKRITLFVHDLILVYKLHIIGSKYFRK